MLGPSFRGRAGTEANPHELLFGNFGNTVSKTKQSNADSHGADDGKWGKRRGRGRVDGQLASLYQGTLEEAIPDDMIRLIAEIGAQGDRS
jgi:hypothetical protein